MKTTLLGLLAETPIHAGAGRGRGVVDLPVAREAATDYPVIPGSSLKGALKELAERKQEKETVSQRFGAADRAGELLVGEARLLLLPVRSLTGAYRWATCPHLIERFRRDLQRAGLGAGPSLPALPELKGAHPVLASGSGALFLEEREFHIHAPPPAELIEALKPLLAHPEARARLGAQLAVLSDDDFAWFARYGLPIQARNQLEDGTKKSNNLWYEESLPPDAVLYALVVARHAEAAGLLPELFPAGRAYLQLGGKETVGQGWFAVTMRAEGAA